MGYLHRLTLLVLLLNSVCLSWVHYIFPSETSKVIHIIIFLVAILIAVYVVNKERILLIRYSYTLIVLILGVGINFALVCHLRFIKYDGDATSLLLVLDVLFFFATLLYSYKYLLSKPIDINELYEKKYIIKKNNDFYYIPRLASELRGIELKRSNYSFIKPVSFLFVFMFIYNLNEHLIGSNFKNMFLIFAGYFFIVAFTYIGTVPYFFIRIANMYKTIEVNDLYANENIKDAAH